jgi:hypothetical protein
MSLIITLSLLGGSVASAGLFGWLGARPRPLGQPRLAPYPFLMLLSAAFALLMTVHLLNLLGMSTGGGQPH